MDQKLMISEIKRMRAEKNAVILSHNYQIDPIQDLADFVGDSLELARKATQANAKMIVMCGVDFMAETAKLLNPEKKVLIPSTTSHCPMSAMLKPKDIIEAKKKHPNAAVVLYVNSSAECKALADSCCTSANADKVVNALPQKEVIFGPDRNLGLFVQKRSSKKIIHLPEKGFCYTHKKFSWKEIAGILKEHPRAEVVAHPECDMEIQEKAHAVKSTSGMLRYCNESNAKEFIIATEVGLLHRLEKENPEKKFYPACFDAVCMQMKDITLEKLYNALLKEQFEVQLPPETARKAVASIQRMLEIT